MDGGSEYGRVEGWGWRQRVEEMVKWRQGGKWEGEQKRNGGRERETETDRQKDKGAWKLETPVGCALSMEQVEEKS